MNLYTGEDNTNNQEKDLKERKPLPKWLLSIPIAVIAVVLCVVFWPKGQNSSQEEYVEQLQASYQEQGITLTSEDIEIRQGSVEVVNQEKANEYVKKVNNKINAVYKKHSSNQVPSTQSSNSTSSTQTNSTTNNTTANDDESEQSNNDQNTDNPDVPSSDDSNTDTDVNSLLELARKKLTDLNSLWTYFDNSKYIDMSTGETYDDKYDKEEEVWYTKQKEIVQKEKDAHPNMTDEEFNTYLWENYDTIFASLPELHYDTSLIDIQTSQKYKAYGFLAASKGLFDKSYADGLGYYAAMKDINHENDMTIINLNDAPFNNVLSSELYKTTPNFSDANTIIEESNKSFANGTVESVMTIKTNDYTIYYGMNGDAFRVLDIEKGW